MRTNLEGLATLRRSAKRSLTVAAALVGAGLSPVVVALAFNMMPGGGQETLTALVLMTIWSALLGAGLATFVAKRALDAPRGPSIGALVGGATAAGVIYPPGLFLPGALLAVPHEWGAGRGFHTLVLFPIAITLIGTIMSAPAGLTFGVVFTTGIGPMVRVLVAPAHDSVARARAYGALMLLAGAGVALLVASLLEGFYCSTLFLTVLPALDIVPAEGTDAAWTRYLVFPAPLVLASIGFALAGWIEERHIARVARAIVSGTHPAWVIDGSAPDETDALPLRESDRYAPRRMLVRAKRDAGAYRGGAAVAVIADR